MDVPCQHDASEHSLGWRQERLVSLTLCSQPSSASCWRRGLQNRSCRGQYMSGVSDRQGESLTEVVASTACTGRQLATRRIEMCIRDYVASD